MPSACVRQPCQEGHPTLGLRHYTHEEATSLMDILEERYHKAPLIVTSQVEPQGSIKLFEDPVIVEAIVDRLIHPS